MLVALKCRAVYRKALRINGCLSPLCSFWEVSMLSYSHRALTLSSYLLCGHHAVEAAQGNVSQVLLQAVVTRELCEAVGNCGRAGVVRVSKSPSEPSTSV